jgi:uncharacterized membrane protein
MTPFEMLLGRTLRAGVAVSTLMLAVGLVLTLAAPGPLADLLLQAGLVVLMGTPMARVLISCAEYVRQRDWFFAVNAFGVLIVLAVTIWHAWRS